MTGVDLTNCDQEPIHIPGAIQPHGALLACRLPDLVIEQGAARTQKGLGLAISRQIVELHGGTIAAESAGLGRGATFRVALPLTNA